MPEITIVVDDARGAIVVKDNNGLTEAVRRQLTADLGRAQTVACARPLKIVSPAAASDDERRNEICASVAGIYHNSLTEGPGRRSSVLFQGCPLKCKNCYVPSLHSVAGGAIVTARQLAEELLDASFERDGVSILGGEPFAQADALLTLISELRSRNCQHIVCYSGYTLETLREKGFRQSVINPILEEIDVLIDGAFVELLASEAGLWTGSGNQRVIDMKRTRETGHVVLYRDAQTSEQ